MKRGLILAIILLSVGLVYAELPVGHPAEQIRPGTFNTSGIFVFPNNLTVVKNFNASGVLFVDGTNGRVGVGTSFPSQLFQVNGSANITGNLTVGFDTKINGTHVVSDFFVGDGSALTGISSSDGTGGWINNSENTTTSFNVGIGISSPLSKLDVKSLGTNTNVFRVLSSASTDSVFRVLEGANNEGQVAIANKTGGNGVVLRGTGISEFLGGNVGIGTSAPAALLEIESSSPSLLLDDTTPSGITGLDVSGDNFITFQNQDGTADIRSGIRARGFGNQYLASIDFVQSSGTGPDGEIVFATTTSGNAGITEAMRIDKDGNVGIGTSTPSTKLDVAGRIVADSFGTVNSSVPGGNFSFRIINGGFYRLAIRSAHSSASAKLGEYLVYGLASPTYKPQILNVSNVSVDWNFLYSPVPSTNDWILTVNHTGTGNQGVTGVLMRLQ